MFCRGYLYFSLTHTGSSSLTKTELDIYVIFQNILSAQGDSTFAGIAAQQKSFFHMLLTSLWYY